MILIVIVLGTVHADYEENKNSEQHGGDELGLAVKIVR